MWTRSFRSVRWVILEGYTRELLTLAQAKLPLPVACPLRSSFYRILVHLVFASFSVRQGRNRFVRMPNL